MRKIQKRRFDEKIEKNSNTTKWKSPNLMSKIQNHESDEKYLIKKLESAVKKWEKIQNLESYDKNSKARMWWEKTQKLESYEKTIKTNQTKFETILIQIKVQKLESDEKVQKLESVKKKFKSLNPMRKKLCSLNLMRK